MASARTRLARWRDAQIEAGHRVGTAEEIEYLLAQQDMADEQIERLYFALFHHGHDLSESQSAWDARVIDADQIARRLPGGALLMLGTVAGEPGALEFFREANELGFGLNQPNDYDFTDDEWAEVAMTRVTVLCSAFRGRHELADG